MTRWQIMAGFVVLGAAAGAGFVAGTQRSEPHHTRLSLSTCGLVPAPAPIDLPLSALMATAGAPGVTLGPILHPGLESPLSIVFRPVEPGAELRPVQTADTLELPVDTARLPDALRLSCRFGAVARVEYRHGQHRRALDVAVTDLPAPAAPNGAPAPALPAEASAPRG